MPPGGTVVELADNNSTALEIEGVDAKDYIVVDTTDGNEVLNLSAGGAAGQRFQVRPTYVTYAASNSVGLMQTGATATSPNVLPNVSDADTGIGRADADQLSLIAGGQEGIRITEAGDAITAVEISGPVGIGVANPADFSGNGNRLVVKGPNHTGITLNMQTNNGSIFFATGTGSDAAELDAIFQWAHSIRAFRWYATAAAGSLDMALGEGGKLSIGDAPDGNQAANNIFIKNGTAPSSDPSGGGFLYVEGGALKYRGSGSTVTTIANA